MSSAARAHSSRRHFTPEDGFLLLGAIVMIALVLIALAVAAPVIARDLRRQKDVEAVHRGNQYVRAIQLYYRKFGRYPGSLDQLENTNTVRFLRRRYTDPITGQDDFAIIPVGQNKTTVKTFFGAPLAGLPTSGAGAGVGSIASMLSPGIGIGANSGPTATSSVSASGATSASAPGGTSASAGPTAASGAATSPTGAPATGSSAAGPASSFGASTGSAGGGLSQPFMGVSLGAKGGSIVELNEQTDYGTWEFLYDPRLDQLKARAAALNGGGPGSTPGSSLGQPNMPTSLTSPGGNPTTPSSPSASPTGTSPSPSQP